MVDISRYASNGACLFRDILNQRTHPGTGIEKWHSWFFVELKYETVNDRVVVYPTIWVNDDMTVRYYFNFLKPDGSSGITEEKRIVLKASDTLCGPKIKLETLEDEGFLENGGIMIEYGFHMESWLDIDGVLNFNFENRFYNGDYCSVEVLNDDETEQFYGHKQIFAFHFNTTSDEIIFRNRLSTIINYVLQLAHGVRKRFGNMSLNYYYGDERTIIDILSCAVHYNLPNVVRIIEMQLMKNEYIFDEEVFEMAVFWKLPHLLAHFLKRSRKDFVISKLTDYCRKPEILERMSGESMKQLIKFLLD